MFGKSESLTISCDYVKESRERLEIEINCSRLCDVAQLSFAEEEIGDKVEYALTLLYDLLLDDIAGSTWSVRKETSTG